MCLLNASKPVNLGRVSEGPQWKDGVAVLTYVDGDLCPDRIRRKSTTIRLTCSENQVNSRPMFISAVEDCEYTFTWPTAAACPVKTNVHGDCQVTNPVTGETHWSPAPPREGPCRSPPSQEGPSVHLAAGT